MRTFGDFETYNHVQECVGCAKAMVVQRPARVRLWREVEKARKPTDFCHEWERKQFWLVMKTIHVRFASNQLHKWE